MKTGVSGRINLELLAEYRDQLFAEPVEAFNNGDRWWPDQQFERELIKPEQAARYQGDVWEDKVETYLATRKRVTVAEIAKEALGFIDKELRVDHAMRIASILRDAGWEQKRSGPHRFWKHT